MLLGAPGPLRAPFFVESTRVTWVEGAADGGTMYKRAEPSRASRVRKVYRKCGRIQKGHTTGRRGR